MATIIRDEKFRGSAEISERFTELAKIVRHKSKQSARKANKAMRKDTTMADLGKFYLVKTNVSLAPFNTRKGTEYMLPANSVCIAINMVGWQALYLTNGMNYDSIEHVKEACKYIRAHKETDFRVIGMPTFRAVERVALKAMLPENWAENELHVAAVKRVYPM